ncbi:MAG TPA: tetratricopeptide repeat protein [Planctomycetota bacterium]|nr:tetratricopeptide repeat protein [Planctomycetota bacterium]
MKTAAALLFLCAAASAQTAPEKAPDRRLVTVREFVVKVESKEPVSFKALWVSRDGGRTWKPARETGVTESWGEWAGGVIRCSVRIPEDGFYDFFPQIGDALSNRGPEPKPGQAADPRLRVDVRQPAKVAHLEWEEPKASADWTGGQNVTLKWHAVEPDFRDRSAELQYSADGEPWISITKGLEPTGSYAWVVPNKDTNQLRLRVRAMTRDSLESTAETESILVRVARKANIVQARALYDRARVLHAQQRVTEARLKYQEAISAWPDFAEVYNDLGKLHSEQHETAKALEYFIRSRKVSPSDPIPVVNAARTETELGLLDDALSDLRDAIALGMDGDERTSVLAGETLWSVAKTASLNKDDRRLREACEMILRIRQAARPTRAKAEQMLEWLKAGAK